MGRVWFPRNLTVDLTFYMLNVMALLQYVTRCWKFAPPSASLGDPSQVFQLGPEFNHIQVVPTYSYHENFTEQKWTNEQPNDRHNLTESRIILLVRESSVSTFWLTPLVYLCVAESTTGLPSSATKPSGCNNLRILLVYSRHRQSRDLRSYVRPTVNTVFIN